MEYTPEQIQELRKCATDPIYFIRNYVRIQHPKLGTVKFELYDYQEEMINNYATYKDNIALSARQTGKAQSYSSKIYTPDGYTLMGDVNVGDTVLTPDGSSAPVIGKYEQGEQDIYRITFDDGSWAEGHEEHLWKCYIRNKWDSSAANGHGGYVVTEQVKTTKDLLEYFEKNKTRKNQRNYNIRFPVVEKVNFPERQLPLDPYVLGLLLGDGTLSQADSIRFTTKDDELIEYLKENITQYDSFVHHITKYDYGITTPQKRNNIVKDILESLNLLGTKSDTKFIPGEYLHSSHEQRLALLQGLMDTDGTVGKRGNTRTISYCTTSEQLRSDIQQLVWSLGGKCSYYIRHPQNEKHKVAYDLYISLPTPKDCFRLERKKELCHDIWRDNKGTETEIRRTVINIEKVRREPAACIQVDHPDHLYITDNFTVTHNTTVAVAFLLWYACFHFDKTILVTSRANEHAMEIIMRIRFAYEQLPHFIKPGIKDDAYNKHEVGFDNNSRIISAATSANAGRGYSISLLYVDELAFVPPNIQEEFWASISPTLATGGSVIITSTPNGDLDLFSELWRGANIPNPNSKDGLGINNYKATRVYWDQPPGRDEAFKQEQIAKLGETKWKQEFLCEFISSEFLLMDSVWLNTEAERLKHVVPINVIKDVVFFRDIKPGGTYLMGVDPATGSGEDYSVITVFEFPSLKQVAEWRSNTMNTNVLYGVLKNLLKYFGTKHTEMYFSIENNGVGEGVIALYEADLTPPDHAEFISEDGKNKRGITTTAKSKMRSCVNLKQMAEHGAMVLNSKVLIAELKGYVRNKGAYAAQIGSTDDCIAATLIVIRLLEEISTYDQTAFDKLYAGEYEEWGSEDYDGYGEYDETDEGMPMAF